MLSVVGTSHDGSLVTMQCADKTDDRRVHRLSDVCHSSLSFVNRLKTPLHLAADKSQFDLMDILLKHGAKVLAASVFVVFLFICL